MFWSQPVKLSLPRSLMGWEVCTVHIRSIVSNLVAVSNFPLSQKIFMTISTDAAAHELSADRSDTGQLSWYFPETIRLPVIRRYGTVLSFVLYARPHLTRKVIGRVRSNFVEASTVLRLLRFTYLCGSCAITKDIWTFRRRSVRSIPATTLPHPLEVVRRATR